MTNFKAIRVLLVIAGIIGVGVGGAQLLIPVAFEASAGIVLGDNQNLLSEIRAAGATLLVAGIVILSGVFVSRMIHYALMLSTLFYLSYGTARVISMVLDGIPGESLLLAAIAEVVIGLLSAFAWYKLRAQTNVTV